MQSDNRNDRYALDASNAKAMFHMALSHGASFMKTTANSPTVAVDESVAELERKMRPSVESVATMLSAAWKGN